MTGLRKRALAGLGSAALLLTLAAAQRPASLANIEGGLWEIDPLGPGATAKLCVADRLTSHSPPEPPMAGGKVAAASATAVNARPAGIKNRLIRVRMGT